MTGIDKDKPVKSLSKFISRVKKIREFWGLAKHKELWFRGESRDYGETILRPELYRPASDGVSIKPIEKLLAIENDLHNEFQRVGIERCDKSMSEDGWDWDSYFLMQHHNGPTRLLDWSDGALMALHFALRNKKDESEAACIYVLEPYRLSENLKNLPDIKILEQQWKAYVAKNPAYELNEDDWDSCYLPASEKANSEMPLPRPPLVLDFPLLNRRIAAQRSRFIVFGTEPTWLYDQFNKSESFIKVIVTTRPPRLAKGILFKPEIPSTSVFSPVG